MKGLSFTRRQVLASVAVSYAAAPLRPLYSQDPVTTITVSEAIAAILAIVDAVNSSRTGRDVKNRLDQIDQKLGFLIIGQNLILDEIEKLKLYIDRALFNSFRREAQIDLNVLHRDYTIYRTSGLSANTLPLFKELETATRRATFRLGEYDFSAFLSFMTGASLNLTLSKILNTPSAQDAALRRQFKDYLEQWLSLTDERGLERALTDARAQTAFANSQLASFRRRYDGPWGLPYMRDGDKCKKRQIFRLQGDLQTPFTESYTIQEECQERTPIGRGDRLFTADLNAAVSPSAPDYSGIPATGPEDTSLGRVNDGNKLRNAVILSMKRERDLEFLRTQMRLAATNLVPV